MGAFGDSRLLIKAARGDRNAIAKVIRDTLPKVHSRVVEARATVDHFHANKWDAEARRREAYAGESSPDAAAQAVEAIYGRVIGVTHLIPLLLISQGEERAAYEKRMGDNLYNLLLVLHNPAIRYGIVGCIEPESRETVDELFEMISAEIWGTLLATTDSGDLSKDDFPDGTRETIENLEASLEELEAER